ncbi:MAG: D-glycero-beta-D-manno-heptose-7-phosphate kinase [Crocinitomicaceae bacterium]|nr:D-glycero-beta-D-manno-heptose-7-phosphate kinase [Crocinitomicaceae bacterium]MBP6032956.1 D-glycero-beta-D-manno-heptose-7-phosphate kinase [Crocinitomicaceae bacterium]
MVDAYLKGKVNRMSPEAPVPVVDLFEKDERIGGAGNVALNLAALGASPIICSVIGADLEGERLIQLFKDARISTDGIYASSNRRTTVKTRVLSNNQQLLRIDSEDTNLINETEEAQLLKQISSVLENGIDGIIFEDYNKGVLTPSLIASVLSLAKEQQIPTTVDPKKDHFFEYKGCTLFKPNLKELKEGLQLDFDFASDKDAFLRAVNDLQGRLGNSISFITLSEHGVFIQEEEAPVFIPAHLRNIADVSGAGDTVIAVATLCLISGAEIQTIAAISNIAGGLVCEQPGVVSIQKEQLLKEVTKLL